MAGRTALITGGGSGMGEAMSRRLAREGMAVAVLDINGQSASSVAGGISRAGGKAVAVTADIADRGQIEGAVATVREALGAITVLVNNAGVESFTPFEDITDSEWDRLIQIDLNGAYIVTQVVLPDMKAAGWGRIVNLTSMAAQAGAARMVNYSAAKGGILAMTRSLAQELGPLGITVNAIAPGLIETDMARRAVEQGFFPMPLAELARHYPIPRAGKPEEVAAACAYFVSEDAGYTNGQVLGINGGTCVQ